MENSLPETLQIIIVTICSKNIYKGFKIYSDSGRTNIVIQFKDYEMQPCRPNLHSRASTSEISPNENSLLKPGMNEGYSI